MVIDELLKGAPIKILKNEEFLAGAQAILGLARQRVDICTYKFDLSERADARDLNSLVKILFTLASNKILVRVLLNTTGRHSGLTKINENAAKILKKNGLQVRCLPDGRCQHAKAIIVDDEFAMIGSHNWSPRSMTDNMEMSVLIKGAEYLQNVKATFNKVWEGSKIL